MQGNILVTSWKPKATLLHLFSRVAIFQVITAIRDFKLSLLQILNKLTPTTQEARRDN